MSNNTFKVKKKAKLRRNSIFSFFEKVVNLDVLVRHGIPVSYLPKFLFISLLGIFYIGNSHYTEKTIRKIARLQIEVDELRADYTSLKAEYMFDSKQSEVARKVTELGLEESVKPPFKIDM